MATVTGLCDNCDPPYTILNYDHDFIPTPEEDFVSNIGIYVFEHKNWFRQWVEVDGNLLYICCVSSNETKGYILIYDIAERKEIKGKLADLDLDSCADEMSQWLAVNKGGVMKRNTVVLQGDNFVINGINYGDLCKYVVDGQAVYVSKWHVINRKLTAIFGEPQAMSVSELEDLNTSWSVELAVGNSDVSVYCLHGADMAKLCRDISTKHGLVKVSSHARYLMCCQNGKELRRNTLAEFYDNITEEDLEATRFF